MTEVSKDEFYNQRDDAGDVTSTIIGEYPYTVLFHARYGPLWGKSTDSYEDLEILTKYYINDKPTQP